MHKRRASALIIGLSLFFALATPGPGLVLAQDGGSQQVQVRAGPYDITIIESLSTLSLGSVEFYITVLDAATGEPVPDAHVIIRTSHVQEGTEGWARALYVPKSPERYEAEVNLDTPGTWNVTVEVASALGTWEFDALPLEVPALRRYRSGTYVFFGVFLVIFLGIGYVWWSARRAQRRRSAVSPSPQVASSDQRPDSGSRGP